MKNILDKVCEILIKNNMKISVAESLTGGMVSERFIDYSGISKVFMEGIVAYSNESKINRLNVKDETLKKYGAVSEETAKEMAIGVSKNFNTEISISTTGVAGPDGGTDKKPVGLVYICVYLNGECFVEKFNFSGDRSEIRNKTTDKVFEKLIYVLENNL